MRKFTGFIKTNKVGSRCDFEFEIEDDATDEEIEEFAKQNAFDLLEWAYSEATS